MILADFRLEGNVALVTGAARGLGKALALGLAEAGADIAALDLLPLDLCLAEITARGRQGEALTYDLSGLTPERAREIIEACVTRFGRLDILVNNAGILRRARALDVTPEDWQAVLDLNLSTVFTLSQAAARYWIAHAQPGRIINIASMLSFQGGVLVPSYTAAKSGLTGLTRALANEWAPSGIHVNAIAPGYMATDVTAAIREDPARNKAVIERIPAGHWGDPSDLQGAVVFLASEASRYVHGAILPVDGGWLAR